MAVFRRGGHVRQFAILMVLFAGAWTATAQHHKPATIDAGTQEGQLLQQIGGETDQAKKLAMLEDFAAKYPKHEGAAWVYEQMMDAYSKAGQYDKVFDSGEKLLALDPADVETAYACLQAAEAKKDPDQVIKWSARTSALARKAAEAPKPTEADAVDAWTHQVDYAKQVDVRSEYSLYATMLETTDPKKRIQLGEALEQRNPQSQYLAQMAQPRFIAYMQTGERVKAVALARTVLDKDQSSVEMLLAVADSEQTAKHWDSAAALSKKAAEVAAAKPKPEGVADADWEKWKTQMTGQAHWTAGLAYAGAAKWLLADKELRIALPGVKSDNAMFAEALFYLGLANYRLGEAGQTERIRDALHFSEQCAVIPGRFQAPARTNVKAIQARYHVQ
jgi:tetratricopeptide (TPR) repeat protein